MRHNELMNRFLETQQRVMMAFLGADSPAAGSNPGKC